MKFTIKDGAVYQTEFVGTAEVTVVFGSVQRLNLISETNTEKVYQWQKFNLEKGVYEDDPVNDTVTEIDGKERIPKQGKIIIHKGTRSLESVEMALTEAYEENLKLKEAMNQLQLAMTEVYEKVASGNS